MGKKIFKISNAQKIRSKRKLLFLKKFLMSLSTREVFLYRAESHKSIKRIIDMIPYNLPLRIINIDFHHDYYHYYSGEDKYNCGNWLRRVIEERPETKVKWIRRKDSQLYSLEGIFPFEHTTDIKTILDERFDYVFICKSPEWSPPHLSNKFEELAWSTLRGKTAYGYNQSKSVVIYGDMLLLKNA